MKKRTISFLSFLFALFISMNYIVYILTQNNMDAIINNELEESIYKLETHNEILLTAQRGISNSLHKSILEHTDIIHFLAQSDTASNKQQVQNRKKLHTQLLSHYKAAQEQGLSQIQLVDKNNIAYLRMNAPESFGDDVGIRSDYKDVSQNHEVTRNFSQGLINHGFSNIFPLFDAHKKYIGALEISFSNDHFQWYLNEVSNIHSHFIVNNSLFSEKTKKKSDFLLKYAQSAEADSHMLHLSDLHTHKRCIVENEVRLKPLRDKIQYNMSEDYDFAAYIKENNYIAVVSFLPITNIDDEVLAWIVSYRPSSVIKAVLENTLYIRVATFFLSLLILYFLVLQFRSREKIQKQHALFETILNTTEDILFITDLKSIKFSNDKCKNLLLSDLHSQKFAKNFNILDFFIPKEGYLHKELLNEGEDFISLLHRTNAEERIVSLLDDSLKAKAFNIHAEPLEEDGNYLVSLSDITELKTALIETAKKAYMDKLTNVYNRHKFDEMFEYELLRVKRYKQPLSIVLIDIDKFKDFNDTHGHLIGDEVLITMAENLNKNVRDTDLFARWGGEEFVILFKETPVDIALTLSLKLKDIIEQAEHPIAGKITGSFGLTQYIQGDTVDSMFKRCDEALYLAKENGRNRVEVL